MNEQNDATKGQHPAVKLEIKWESPEATIESFTKVDDDLTAKLAQAADALTEAEIAADKASASAEVEIRTAAASSGNKITEGYVVALMARNEDVAMTAAKVKRLATEVARYKCAIASLERKHSLYKRWLDNQRPIGLNER